MIAFGDGPGPGGSQEASAWFRLDPRGIEETVFKAPRLDPQIQGPSVCAAVLAAEDIRDALPAGMPIPGLSSTWGFLDEAGPQRIPPYIGQVRAG